MDIRSVLMELCEAFNAPDLDRIMTFFSDDCVLEMPRGDRPWGSRAEGKPDVRKALRAASKACRTCITARLSILWMRSPIPGISNWHLTGTARQGTRTEVRGCDFYTFRDSKVIRKDSYWKIVE